MANVFNILVANGHGVTHRESSNSTIDTAVHLYTYPPTSSRTTAFIHKLVVIINLNPGRERKGKSFHSWFFRACQHLNSFFNFLLAAVHLFFLHVPERWFVVIPPLCWFRISQQFIAYFFGFVNLDVLTNRLLHSHLNICRLCLQFRHFIPFWGCFIPRSWLSLTFFLHV